MPDLAIIWIICDSVAVAERGGGSGFLALRKNQLAADETWFFPKCNVEGQDVPKLDANPLSIEFGQQSCEPEHGFPDVWI